MPRRRDDRGRRKVGEDREGGEGRKKVEKAERIARTAEKRATTVVNEGTEGTYIAEAFDGNQEKFLNWREVATGECSDDDIRRIKDWKILRIWRMMRSAMRRR